MTLLFAIAPTDLQATIANLSIHVLTDRAVPTRPAVAFDYRTLNTDAAAQKATRVTSAKLPSPVVAKTPAETMAHVL